MHPESMKRLVMLLASSALLACVTHDDTTFQAQPPGSTTGPTRFIVDAGLVILSDARGVVLGGGAGQTSPEAGVQPDLAPDLPASDAGGIGTPCDVFATATTIPPTPCLGNQQCSPNRDGTGSCQRRGSVSAGGFCTTDPDQACDRQLFCATLDGLNTTCVNLCRLGQPTTGYCVDSTGSKCVRLGTSETVGYCAANLPS